MGQVPYFDSDGRFLGSVESSDVKTCRHSQREDIGECSAGCCDRYKCLDCGKKFLVECPD